MEKQYQKGFHRFSKAVYASERCDAMRCDCVFVACCQAIANNNITEYISSMPKLNLCKRIVKTLCNSMANKFSKFFN